MKVLRSFATKVDRFLKEVQPVVVHLGINSNYNHNLVHIQNEIAIFAREFESILGLTNSKNTNSQNNNHKNHNNKFSQQCKYWTHNCCKFPNDQCWYQHKRIATHKH